MNDLRAIRWVGSGDTGVSSEAIWSMMMGAEPSREWGYSNYPHDPDDFGRCYRLLELMPEWRLQLDKMRALSPEWSALVDAWPELEQLWREEGDGTGRPPFGTRMHRLFTRMQAVFDAVREKKKAAR